MTRVCCSSDSVTRIVTDSVIRNVTDSIIRIVTDSVIRFCRGDWVVRVYFGGGVVAKFFVIANSGTFFMTVLAEFVDLGCCMAAGFCFGSENVTK